MQRHVVQHLNQEPRTIGNRRAAALGTITWLGGSQTEDSPPVAWVLQPGSFYPRQRALGRLSIFSAESHLERLLRYAWKRIGTESICRMWFDASRKCWRRLNPPSASTRKVKSSWVPTFYFTFHCNPSRSVGLNHHRAGRLESERCCIGLPEEVDLFDAQRQPRLTDTAYQTRGISAFRSDGYSEMYWR